MAVTMLGIDVSTTAAKALLIAQDGQVIASAATGYTFDTPRPLWSEQDPSDFWRATVQSIRDVLEKSQVPAHTICAVGITGQMHGLTILDAQGDPLRPCILWNDQRTADECAQIRSRLGRERILELTGNPVLTGFMAPKLMWVRSHEPDVYRRIEHVLLPKDYVRFRLTGEFLSDVSDASGTSLFDVANRRWSEDMLHALDVPRRWLPEVTESPVVSATLDSSAANLIGLRAGTPVVGGAGDQAAQAVGVGAVDQTLASITLGTSGIVFATSDTYSQTPDGSLHMFCHAVPGKWHSMGVVLSAGGSLRWFRDSLAKDLNVLARQSGRSAYDLLTAEAEKIPPGSEGLVFLPYLTGERTPHADPDARGVFFGLTLRHARPHMTRAILEGVAFALRDQFELMSASGIRYAHVRLSGGGARSALWRHILADVLEVEVSMVNVAEGAAFGVALLAGVGAGVYSSVQSACEETIALTDCTVPSQLSAVYADYYPRYHALYPVLAAEFASMTKVVGRHAKG